ncbi:hypothetical protein ACQ86I_05350 [Prescottella equi]
MPLRPPRWFAIVAAAIAVLFTTACSNIDSTFAARPAGGGDRADVVKVGTLRGQPHLFHPFFYERFAPEGTAVDVVVFDSSPDIKNALVSGAIDFGVAGVPAFLAGSAAGQDVRLVASAADGAPVSSRHRVSSRSTTCGGRRSDSRSVPRRRSCSA